MGKVEENKKQKKDILLKSAFDLFTNKGITKTSISDIVEKAGVAKGTFYLYFKDKYDLKNKLISHKASQIFMNASHALELTSIDTFEDTILFLVDHIIDQLSKDKLLLSFISKNLSWGVFKTALSSAGMNKDVNFYELYMNLIDEYQITLKEPEILLFMIVELVGSTCHDTILYGEPASIISAKPYILQSVRYIIRAQIDLSKAAMLDSALN